MDSSTRMANAATVMTRMIVPYAPDTTSNRAEWPSWVPPGVVTDTSTLDRPDREIFTGRYSVVLPPARMVWRTAEAASAAGMAGWAASSVTTRPVTEAGISAAAAAAG